jgi:ABC-type Fe3+-hydroxamate transport system substrate-binding protein
MNWLDPNGLRKKYYLHPRVVCLVPSLTELLLDGGLEEQVVGRTKFCIHPEGIIKKIPVVGGTKKINIEKVLNLLPDIVIANKEENTKSDIEAISQFSPVFLTDIKTIEDIVKCIEELMAHIPEFKEDKIINPLKHLAIDRIFSLKTVAYLIWNDPVMVAGSDTFIHHILTRTGLNNVFSYRKRYPEITMQDLKDKKPDYIFLSSEPYPFKEIHVKHFTENLPFSQVFLVDGEMFSWYGSRMLKAPDYFLHLEKHLIKSDTFVT